MSPTIRSVNGQPLFIGGMVAGADECCCENPPPPGCFCADLCSYDIQLVSPAITSVRTPANDCLAFTFPTNTTSVFLDDWMFPETDFGDFVPCTEVPGLVGVIKPVSVFSVARRFPGDLEARTWVYVLLCDPSDPTTEDAIVSIRVNLRMTCDPWTQQPYVEVQSWAYVGDDDDESNRSSIVVSNYGSYRPPSTCLAPGARICATDPAPWFRTAFLDTPLDVTVRLDGTSLGSYTLGRPGGEERGDIPNPFRAIFDSVVANTEFTFRITSRPNCEPEIYCDCTAITEGLTISVLGAADFIWNQEEQYQTYTDLANFYSYSYSPQGPGNEARIVIEQWNLSITETYARWTIDIFCEAVPSGIPSPYRWYGSQLVECFEYDAGSVVNWTKKTYMGYFNCEADPCGTNGRSLGDLYPAGPWRDGELVSEVTPDTYGPCAPPLPYDFRVDNDAECP